MAYGLYHVASTGLSLGTNHGSALSYTSQCLSEVACTADKRYVKLCLVDVIDVVSRREHLALIDIVYLYCLKYLGLCDMTYTAFCHNRNADSSLNALYHLRVAHG